MMGINPDDIISFGLALCRIGACIMLLPGIGTARIPLRVRLTAAVMLAAAINPNIAHKDHQLTEITEVVMSELIIGATIGGTVRVVFMAAAFAASLISAHVGLMMPSQSVIDEYEQVPHLADVLIVMVITSALLFDLHLHLIKTLHTSYAIAPPSTVQGLGIDDISVMKQIKGATHLGLQLATPLIVLAVLFYASLGVVARALPMVPTQFVGAPALLLLGTMLLGDVAPGVGHKFIEKIKDLVPSGAAP
jgi:flagellar biosynthesis protein FliR